jgi:hypothetical protein
MNRKSILLGLIAICCVCISPAVSYSQSPQVGITSERAQALVAAAVGLISLIIGGLALARAADRIATRKGRAGAIVALVLGLIGMILSVVHLAGTTGFGTGGGRAGAIVALVLTLIGMSLGGLALARSRRRTRDGNVID